MRRLALSPRTNSPKDNERSKMGDSDERHIPEKKGTCCSVVLVIAAIISGVAAIMLLRKNIGQQKTILILLFVQIANIIYITKYQNIKICTLHVNQ